jgi:hypothetical protein
MVVTVSVFLKLALKLNSIKFDDVEVSSKVLWKKISHPLFGRKTTTPFTFYSLSQLITNR